MGPEASAAKRARRFPPWIRKRIPAGDEAARVRRLLADLGLATVCSGAHCPNLAECYARGTATFLILGESCTRSCRFCAIPTADPGSPREDEPEAVAEAAARLGLRHVVVTSVTRDDLADGGAGHFARTIRAVRARLPQAVIEVLTPDFQGSRAALDAVLGARPDIFNHNVETAPRLYPAIRPEADYRRSLEVLAYVKRQAEGCAKIIWHGPRSLRSHCGKVKQCGTAGLAPPCAPHGRTRPAVPHEPCFAPSPSAGKSWRTQAEDRGLKTWTKSGLMVGLGETPDEVRGVLGDLREAGCDIVTIGQYLSPSAAHAPVARFVEPGEFEAWEAEARAMGFRAAASGPFVRSSYEAERLFRERAGSPRGLKTRVIFEPGAGAPG